MFVKEMVKQSLPLLILCGLGAVVAGSILGLMNAPDPESNLFIRIPGLIVVIPAIIAMRGNISSAFGSRLGSAYHLGVIDVDNLWNKELNENIFGSFVLSLLTSTFIGILAYITSFILGVYPNPFLIISIVVVSGLISGIVLNILTIGIIYIVFKRGYDPDNITGPALATFGDIITILCIYTSILLLGGLI